MGNGDFQTEDLDSFENVIGLSPRDPLNGFAGKFKLHIGCKGRGPK